MSDYGDDEDHDAVMEDDDITVDSIDYDEEPVRLDESKSTLIMIDNVPIIGMDRYEKLCAVIRRLFSAYGTVSELFLPYDNDNNNGVSKTLGYAFVEYETQEQAQRAVIEGNNKKLDAQHTLLVSSFDDYEKLSKISETFIPPKREDYENKANVGSWLLDPNTRDQFLLRYSNETQIYWFDPLRKLNENCRDYKYGGEREKANDKHWCELYTEFSPKGNYLVTYHIQGIALWGGDQFERLGRFGHQNVQHILFSPCEKYIITSNITPLIPPQSTPSPAQEKEKIIVWDLRKGKMLREFERKDIESSIALNNDNPNGPLTLQWPLFKWSHDDKYFARRGKDKEGKESLFVYETPSMQLIDKKSIKMPGLQDFLWSPTENIISYWIPEQDNHPALVGIIEIPSRTIKREKHLYNVINVKMYWQDQGDYLCVKLLRKKTKKTTSTNLELFRMKTKDIPIEVLEIDYPVNSFAWEPGHNGGHRFAILHGESVAGKVSLSLYDAKKKIKLIKTFEQRSANSLFWSPAGIIVAAGLTNGAADKMNGTLEWFDAEAGESVASSEHFMCNEVEWDPSGRYLLTAVTQPLNETNFKYGMESGYRMWTMHGQPLCSVPVEQCYQAMWRPRPASLLSKDQLLKLKENLKEKYWKKFEQEDEEIRQTQLTGAAKERRELKQQWKQYRSGKEQEYQEEAAERRELRGYDSDSEDNYAVVEQLVEEELGREEFVL